MTPDPTVADQLRAQIEATADKDFSTETIELRIAASLVETGRFCGQLNEDELARVIRNVVYSRFSQQKIGGRNLGLVHNVPVTKVELINSEARVNFLVHIHSPIVAFLRFRYVLINDPLSTFKRLRMKKGTLSIKKDTRRFDLKAKAALSVFDVEGIALKELTDLADIIKVTLCDQMNGHGINGNLSEIQLEIEERFVGVSMEGRFQFSDRKTTEQPNNRIAG